MYDKASERWAGEAACVDYSTVQGPASLQCAEHRSSPPAGLADHNQLRSALASSPDQLAPDVQQQEMVFTRLDHSAHHKVIVSCELLIVAIFLEEYWRNWEERGFDRDLGSAAQPERLEH